MLAKSSLIRRKFGSFTQLSLNYSVRVVSFSKFVHSLILTKQDRHWTDKEDKHFTETINGFSCICIFLSFIMERPMFFFKVPCLLITHAIKVG